MSYPPTPIGYGHYYPAYPQQGGYPGFPAPTTPGTVQPPYGFPFAPPPGYMPGPQGMTPGNYIPPPAITGFYMDDMAQEEDDVGMDEDEVDMEMPLDQHSAEQALKHMVFTQLFLEGFDGGQASAVNLLLNETVGCEYPFLFICER